MRSKLSIFLIIIVSLIFAQSNYAADGDTPDTGKSLAFDKNKGNCLACHAIPGDPSAKSPGNIGPPLMSMKIRFPDRAKLRSQIWDATVASPKTSMPPFGKNKVLTEPEIDLITDYIHGN